MSRTPQCFGTLSPADPTSCDSCLMHAGCALTNYHNQLHTKENPVFIAKPETLVLDQELMRPDGPILVNSPKTKANERQVAGTHYKEMGVEPWDVVDTWPLEQQIGAYRHGALKYLMRMGTKDQRLQEIEKGIHYLEKLAEVLRAAWVKEHGA